MHARMRHLVISALLPHTSSPGGGAMPWRTPAPSCVPTLAQWSTPMPSPYCSLRAGRQQAQRCTGACSPTAAHSRQQPHHHGPPRRHRQQRLGGSGGRAALRPMAFKRDDAGGVGSSSSSSSSAAAGSISSSRGSLKELVIAPALDLLSGACGGGGDACSRGKWKTGGPPPGLARGRMRTGAAARSGWVVGPGQTLPLGCRPVLGHGGGEGPLTHIIIIATSHHPARPGLRAPASAMPGPSSPSLGITQCSGPPCCHPTHMA